MQGPSSVIRSRAVTIAAPWPGLLVWCLALLFTGCSQDREVAPRALWSGERSWVRVDDGWIHAVALRERKLLHPAGFERFRAVVFPVSGTARVDLLADGRKTTRVFTGPGTLDWELPAADELALSAAEEVYLLRPRLVGGNRRGRGKRILLVVADTLRFDHANARWMPEVDQYFATGTRFLEARSPASWTLPSLASIFTGALPAKLRTPDGTLISLSPEASTIASELSERGYSTLAVTANYTVNHENGYSRGFDLFYAPRPRGREPGEMPDAQWVGERAREASGWLEDQDLFLYLQFMEPHEPYRDHETGQVRNAFGPEQEVTPQQVEALRAAYGSEVRYLSRRLGALLRDLGPIDLAVFTSDHGEEFYEHRGFRHGPTIFDEVVHVPLWIRGAGIEQQTISTPVSLVALKDFIVGGDRKLFRPQRLVTMETFSYGPPRWACIIDRTKAIYFARQMVPKPPAHPIARWLHDHHPIVSLTPLPGAGPVAGDQDFVGESIRGLVEQFTGLRAGLFLLLQGQGSYRLGISGTDLDGLLWGEPERFEIPAAGEGELVVEVVNPQPWALLFLPTEDTQQPQVIDLERRQRLVLGNALPGRFPEQGVTGWLDGGRPQHALRGVAETLERLKALGYID
ncbi:MAG: sulfatase-like hydrolase/transferase [bacterium]|nr:sulfatase-like hydrolase/transferase [bacterium]